MKELTIAGHNVVIYEDVDEMPMANYHRFNKFVMFESGLAPDAQGVVQHIVKVSQLIATGNNDKAQEELSNMMQAINYIMGGISPMGMAFASLVYSLDGERITDYSDESLQRISNILAGESFSTLRDKVLQLKKKLTTTYKRTLARPLVSRQKKKQHNEYSNVK